MEITESVLAEARDLAQQGHFSELIKLKEHKLPLTDQPEMDLLVGKSYLSLGELEEAETFLSRSLSALKAQYPVLPNTLRHQKTYIQAMVCLGSCYFQLQDYSQSLILNEAEKIFSSLPQDTLDEELLEIAKDLYFHLAKKFRFEKKYKEAIESLSQAFDFAQELEPDPFLGDQAFILFELGINYNLAKEYEAAELRLNNALELLQEDPQDHEYLLIADLKQQLGFSSLKQNKLEAAKAIFLDVLSTYNMAPEENLADIASAQFMLSFCYLRTQHYKDFEEYLQPSLRVFSDPNLPMEELQKACSFIKLVVEGESLSPDPRLIATNNYLKQLVSIQRAIQRIETLQNHEETGAKLGP